jgi:hypothetical protein
MQRPPMRQGKYEVRTARVAISDISDFTEENALHNSAEKSKLKTGKIKTMKRTVPYERISERGRDAVWRYAMGEMAVQ